MLKYIRFRLKKRNIPLTFYTFALKFSNTMKPAHFFLIMCLLLFSSVVKAQDVNDKKQSIFTSLSKPDSITGAKVKLNGDKRIEQLVNNKKISTVTETVSGYRVQVFSSNAQRTAKTEAFRTEKMIKEYFPDQAIYVNYISPFWKVRVGDFKTLEEAQKFRAELIDIFPELKSETYTVKDQIVQ
jgi:hypothetical protein